MFDTCAPTNAVAGFADDFLQMVVNLVTGPGLVVALVVFAIGVLQLLRGDATLLKVSSAVILVIALLSGIIGAFREIAGGAGNC
jgi:hypothetical protein